MKKLLDLLGLILSLILCFQIAHLHEQNIDQILPHTENLDLDEMFILRVTKQHEIDSPQKKTEWSALLLSL